MINYNYSNIDHGYILDVTLELVTIANVSVDHYDELSKYANVSVKDSTTL